MKYKKLLFIVGLLFSLVLFAACSSDPQPEEETPSQETQEESAEPEYEKITGDDILSVAPGDLVEIDCYTGNIMEGQHSDSEQMFHVYLHAKGSDGVEWDVDAMNAVGATQELMEQLTDIMNKTPGSKDYPGYDITIRGKVSYAGEGEEGSGHPHGIYFDWNDSEIIKVSENQ